MISGRFDGLVVPLHARIDCCGRESSTPTFASITIEVGMNGPRFNFSEVSPDEYRAEMHAFGQQHEMN